MSAHEGSRAQELQEAASQRNQLAPKVVRDLAAVAAELQEAVAVVERGKVAAGRIPALRAELDRMIGKAPRKARKKKEAPAA